MSQSRQLTQAVEEYLEAIHRFSESDGPTTTRLAKQLRVAPASVTGMLRRLAEQGLIRYQRYGRIALTPEGRRRARSVIRRHRLAERLLTDVLDVPLERVHDEACRLEHALSPEVEDRIAQTLGDPEVCPHGNPIDVQSRGKARRLTEAAQGRDVTIIGLANESPEVVRYLTEHGLMPPARVTVTGSEPVGGGVIVTVDGVNKTLSRELADTIRVLPDDEGERP
jgi:DtxR family Mn-dependent transcriptional regulator